MLQFLNNKYSINLKVLIEVLLQPYLDYSIYYMLIDSTDVVTVSFFNKIKCSTQPEPLVKWCV